MCLDIDEFLFAPAEARLTSVLAGFEAYPGVVVRWQVYGSSGHARASDAPVIERFVRRAPTGWIRNRRVKSIVDPSRTLAPLSTHHFAYAGGALPVTERKEPVRLRRSRRLPKRLRPLATRSRGAGCPWTCFASTTIR
jgi:hypothetical protein